MSENQENSNYISWPKQINKIMFVIVMEHEAKDVIDLLNLKKDETCLNDPFLESFIGEY